MRPITPADIEALKRMQRKQAQGDHTAAAYIEWLQNNLKRKKTA